MVVVVASSRSPCWRPYSKGPTPDSSPRFPSPPQRTHTRRQRHDTASLCSALQPGALGLADLRIEERLHRYMVGGTVAAAAAPHRSRYASCMSALCVLCVLLRLWAICGQQAAPCPYAPPRSTQHFAGTTAASVPAGGRGGTARVPSPGQTRGAWAPRGRGAEGTGGTVRTTGSTARGTALTARSE